MVVEWSNFRPEFLDMASLWVVNLLIYFRHELQVLDLFK